MSGGGKASARTCVQGCKLRPHFPQNKQPQDKQPKQSPLCTQPWRKPWLASLREPLNWPATAQHTTSGPGSRNTHAPGADLKRTQSANTKRLSPQPPYALNNEILRVLSTVIVTAGQWSRAPWNPSALIPQCNSAFFHPCHQSISCLPT